MDNEKINLVGRWVIMGILACGAVTCIFTGKADYSYGLAIAAFLFWMLTD